ncbi:hypothetical protein CB1_000204024 [Camelus ferus]|nr:hypothetical protein CB1_000204024 [Camelus ferus]
MSGADRGRYQGKSDEDRAMTVQLEHHRVTKPGVECESSLNSNPTLCEGLLLISGDDPPQLHAVHDSGDSGSPSSGADMAKLKNHTTHNQSQKWHRNGIQNPRSQQHKSLEGVDPKFPRNVRFAKKHNKEGLKRMQANNTKATGAHAEAVKALVKPKEIKSKVPRAAAASSVNSPALLTPSSGKVLVRMSPRGSGSVGQRQRPRLRPRPQLQLQLRRRLRLPKVPRPHRSSRVEAFIY